MGEWVLLFFFLFFQIKKDKDKTTPNQLRPFFYHLPGIDRGTTVV